MKSYETNRAVTAMLCPRHYRMILFVLMCCRLGGIAETTGNGDVRFEVVSNDYSFPLNAPKRVDLKVTNGDQQYISFKIDGLLMSLKASVEDSVASENLEEHRYAPKVHRDLRKLRSRGDYPLYLGLGPGEHNIFKLDLNGFLKFRKAGTYSIELSGTLELLMRDGGKEKVEVSTAATVRIMPESESALQGAIAELSPELISPDMWRSTSAAISLFLLDHPDAYSALLGVQKWPLEGELAIVIIAVSFIGHGNEATNELLLDYLAEHEVDPRLIARIISSSSYYNYEPFYPLIVLFSTHPSQYVQDSVDYGVSVTPWVEEQVQSMRAKEKMPPEATE